MSLILLLARRASGMRKEVCSCLFIYKYVWPDDIKGFHSGEDIFSTVYPEGRSDCSAQRSGLRYSFPLQW